MMKSIKQQQQNVDYYRFQKKPKRNCCDWTKFLQFFSCISTR